MLTYQPFRTRNILTRENDKVSICITLLSFNIILQLCKKIFKYSKDYFSQKKKKSNSNLLMFIGYQLNSSIR